MNKETTTTLTVSKYDNPDIKFSCPLVIVKGIPFARFCNEERFNYVDSVVKYKKSDIIIVSYPKSGTTWMEQILLLLLNNGDESIVNPREKNNLTCSNCQVGKVWLEACLDQKENFGIISQ